ncbi:hypothetical protein D3C84_990730 [compost metagenome]
MGSSTSRRSSRPSKETWRKYSSMVMPAGTGKSGRKYLPICTSILQRRAISTVFSSASGKSLNSSAISCGVFRYC